MRTSRKQELHVQHVLHGQVARIERVAGHFVACIHAGEGFADGIMCGHDDFLNELQIANGLGCIP
jgi:hypothetical protein